MNNYFKKKISNTGVPNRLLPNLCFTNLSMKLVILLLCIGYQVLCRGQIYIENSTYLGTKTGTFWQEFPAPSLSSMEVIGNQIYVIGRSQSENYPVTNGTTYSGLWDGVFTVLDATTLEIITSTYYGGPYLDIPLVMEVIGNDVHIFGTTNVTGVTGTGDNLFYLKLDAVTGSTISNVTIGGSLMETANNMIVINDDVYLIGNSLSLNYPVTDGSLFSGGGSDIVFTHLNSNTGAIITSGYIGGNGVDVSHFSEIVGDVLHLYGTTSSSNFPVTNGSTWSGSDDFFYTQVDINTGEIIFSTYLGGVGAESTLYNGYPAGGMHIEGNLVYLLGKTASIDYPTTDGTSFLGANDFVYTLLDATTGEILVSTLIGGSGNDVPIAMQIVGGEVYLVGSTSSAISYPVTNGSTNAGVVDWVYTRLDGATGNIIFSTYLGGSSIEDIRDFRVDGNDIHIFGGTSSIDFPVTDGSVRSTPGDMAYVRIDATTGDVCLATFLGGSSADNAADFEVIGDDVYIFAGTYSITYPVTNGTTTAATGSEFVITHLTTCPPFPIPTSDIISPATQTLCQNGIAATLMGTPLGISSTDLPIIYRNSVAQAQNMIEPLYQWQVSSDGATGWTDILGATSQNYIPIVGSESLYYRRIASQESCCGGATISTSDVAAILVTSNIAPVANAGGVFFTCIGSPVTIGGSPIATGGLEPYNVLWDNGLGTVSNPSVSPTIPTIYTLQITDANNCIDLDQATVLPYTANAGVDKSNCNGQGTTIGTAAIAGLSGVSYTWTASPADLTMSCTDCAQPKVNPSVATTYTLTMILPVTGGGTCTTLDDVLVTPVAGPVTPDFAGPDRIMCLGTTATLGMAPETGFTYTWAPGSYLTVNNASTTTYQTGNLAMPIPNPGLYYVTAIKNLCSFVDEVETAVIEARAGIDGCGPRNVGMADRTPNIDETYSWVKISGPGNFVGATDLPIVPVSASVGGSTIYELTVSYTFHGITQTCTDQVVVPECGCVVDVSVAAPFSCPSFGLNGGDVILTATAADIFSSDPDVFTYTWSPTDGLASIDQRTMRLTDNINRTYTVTMSSPYDPSFNCSRTIEVNNPAWSLPVFAAQDAAICAGQSVSIGQPFVAGYSYLWQGTTLSSNTDSNPVATPISSTEYTVLVTDVGSGCTVRDTATVVLAMPIADAGDDITVCNGSSVILGSFQQPNTTYQWSPSGGITYLNGTSSTSAQPEFVVAATNTFTVVATNTLSGCTASDDVTVTVGTPVAPFTLPDINYCPGSGPVTLNPDGIPLGMASYHWSLEPPVTNHNIATTTTLNPPPSSTTTYTLTVENITGCTFSATQTIIPTLSPPLVTNNQTICYSNNPLYNESILLGGAGELGATYSWTPITGLSDPNIPNPLFTPTAASGPITFTVTKSMGGCATTATVIITVNGFQLPDMANPVVCQNSEIRIGTPMINGVTYIWSPTTGLSDPYISNPIFTAGTQSQTFTLTAIGTNGCMDTRIITVTVNPLPAPQITLSPATACLGDSDVYLNPVITPAGNYSYLWSPINSTMSNAYIENPEIYVFTSGIKNYGITVTDNTTGCYSSAATTLTVSACSFSADCVPPIAPELSVTQNDCPALLGSFSIVTDCGVGSHIEYSTDGGINWSTLLPAWADGVSVIARCVDDLDATCVSSNSAAVVAILQAPPTAPELSVTQNDCPALLGSFSLVTDCGVGSHIEYSTDGGINWSTLLPAWADGVSVIAHCVDDLDATCVSSNSAAVVADYQFCCPSTNCINISVNAGPKQ